VQQIYTNQPLCKSRFSTFFSEFFILFFSVQQVLELPEILAINSSLDNEKDLEYLKRQIYRKDGPPNGDSPPQQQQQQQQPIKKPCRYGLNCSRVDCHFTHQNRKSPTSNTAASTPPTPVTNSAQKSSETWFPLTFSMSINVDGDLNVISENYFVKEVSYFDEMGFYRYEVLVSCSEKPIIYNFRMLS
jgi:hypothetical protein